MSSPTNVPTKVPDITNISNITNITNVPTRVIEIEDKSSVVKAGNILFYIALSMIIMFVAFPVINYLYKKRYYVNLLDMDAKLFWLLVSYVVVGLALSISLMTLASKVYPPSCNNSISTQPATKKSNVWITEKGKDGKFDINIDKCTMGDVNDPNCWECPVGYSFDRATINNRENNEDVRYSGTCIRLNEKCMYDKPDVADEQTKYGKRFMTMGGVFLGLNILLLLSMLALRGSFK